jgi:peptidoglycan hydrolase CwlO-like protein
MVGNVGDIALATKVISECQKLERGEDRRTLHRIENKIDDLHNQIGKLMSKISDFADNQEANNKLVNDGLEAAVTSISDIGKDIQSLNDKITELQNSVGGVTPEDQARIDSLQSQGSALASKTEAVRAALQALDDLTPGPTPTPEPTLKAKK